MKRILSLVTLALFAVLLISSCSKDSVNSGSDSEKVAVTSITLDPVSLTMTAGQTATINVSISPANASNKTVVWESSNTAVATVEGGKVTALSQGTATITAKTADGGKQAKCSVEVTAPALGDGVELTSDVQYIGPLQSKSFTAIVNDSTLQMLASVPDELLPKAGTILMCDYGNGKYFVGKVTSYKRSGLFYIVETEIPTADEVFSKLDINAEINASNSYIEYDFLEEDGIISCEFVDESVWEDIDGIEVKRINELYSNVDNDNADVQTVPVSINFEFKVNKGIFHGSVYTNYSGSISFSGSKMVKMDVNQRIGLKGAFNLAEVSTGRKYIPILRPEKYVRLYSYGHLVTVSLKPEVDWFYGGKITLESSLQLELDNTTCHLLKTEGNDLQCSIGSNKKQTYFRVKNLHTESEVGLSAKCSFLASVINEKLLGAGLDIAGGISIRGEKNVRLQFPGGINFNLNAQLVPFLEASPFVVVRTLTGLKKFSGGPFSVPLSAFTVPLLPEVDGLKGTNKGNNIAKVSGTLINDDKCFIDTKEDGIAIFEKGSIEPKERKQFSNTKSLYGEMEFRIDDEKEYEIAQYVLDNNQYIYGERVPLEGCPDENHPHAIDLGLSVKWACCNVGASRPEEYGGYYAWGETEQKSVYNEVTYKYSSGIDTDDNGWYEKDCSYQHIGIDISGTQYDVAHIKWGGSWRMPTIAEFNELVNNCTSEWTTLNGVQGRRFTSKINGNSIFLPASGFRENTGFDAVGSGGYYLSSSILSGTDAKNLGFYLDSEYVCTGDIHRDLGQSVRPVTD